MSWLDQIRERIAGDNPRQTDARVQRQTTASAQHIAAESATQRERGMRDPRSMAFDAIVAEEIEARRQLDDALDGISPDIDIDQAEARWRAAVQDREAAWPAGQGSDPGWRSRAEYEDAAYELGLARRAAENVWRRMREVGLAGVSSYRVPEQPAGWSAETATAAELRELTARMRWFTDQGAAQLAQPRGGAPSDPTVGDEPLAWLHVREHHSEPTGQQRASAGPTVDCERAVNQARQATDRAQHTRNIAWVEQREEAVRAERVERWQHADTASGRAEGHGQDRGEGLA